MLESEISNVNPARARGLSPEAHGRNLAIRMDRARVRRREESERKDNRKNNLYSNSRAKGKTGIYHFPRRNQSGRAMHNLFYRFSGLQRKPVWVYIILCQLHKRYAGAGRWQMPALQGGFGSFIEKFGKEAKVGEKI